MNYAYQGLSPEMEVVDRDCRFGQYKVSVEFSLTALKKTGMPMLSKRIFAPHMAKNGSNLPLSAKFSPTVRNK